MPFFAAIEETLDRATLEALQRQKLSNLLRAVLATNPFYRRKLTDVRFDPARDPLQLLPFTTRGELQEDQLNTPPYGSNLTFPLERYVRLHQTSGTLGTPLRWLDTKESWEWWLRCWATVYRAAGIISGDRLVFPFSFGPFIGFWSAFESAFNLGNLSLAAGGMTTSARLRYLLDNQVTVVCCTPTYALHMAEVAERESLDLRGSNVRALIVAGEPGGNILGVRGRIESAFGARVFDHAGMTEVGACASECVESPGGVHVFENEYIAEVVEPSTGKPIAEGQIGELVLTNLGRIGSPVIRYRTGDLVQMQSGQCRCGRWFSRLEGGILGRADDMVIIRGNNIFPAAVEGIVCEFAEVAELRLVLDRRSSMPALRIELEPKDGHDLAGLPDRVALAVRDRLHFRPEVSLVPSGSLPRFELKARRIVKME